MKRKHKYSLIIILMLCITMCIQVRAHAQSFVAEHGALELKGTQLTGKKSGKPVQLHGVSTHGINWDVGYPYISKAAFQTLRDEYGVNAIRLAMYTTEYYGYCDKAGAGESQSEVQKVLKNRIDTGVQAATDLGMYVIIDWHVLNDQNPNKYKKQAKAFFKEMSQKYQNYNNVLYEICNEPNGGTSWEDIKKYAKEVIPVIRKNDSDAVVIVGTPNWSQRVDEAANSPLDSSYGNVMYTLHFYSATHTTDSDVYRNYITAHEKGLPVFVTEFGVSEASGNGNMNTSEAEKWLKKLDKDNVSYFAWSLSNKAETASLLSASTQKKSGWKKSDLSGAGKWVLGRYKKTAGTVSNNGLNKVSAVVLKNKKGRKLMVTFKSVTGADGYEIMYSYNKNFKKAKKVKTTKTRYIIKKCKKKTYYVKVRTFKNVNGQKKYGTYSQKKSCKIKR